MSIQPVSKTDTNSNIGSRLASATAVGAAAGGLYTAKDSHWLYKGAPSDSFVKNVKKNLKKDMTNEELLESSKIYRFVEKIVDPTTDLETLKPLIKDSKELSEAIKINKEESVDNAINRVFSQNNESKIKQDLISLQYKTTSNKKFGKSATLRLIHDNFNAKEQKLVKNNNTTEEVFNMLKRTANKVQAKAVATGAALAGLAGCTLALIFTDIPDKS
ncbi:hypothetical protein J6O48_04195 [bacterium]|nr:hypothetical protein [bacterium]